MDKINKYLTETRKQDALNKYSDNYANYLSLQKAYDNAVKYTKELAIELNSLTGETGEFGVDLGAAVKARDSIKKLAIGKFL